MSGSAAFSRGHYVQEEPICVGHWVIIAIHFRKSDNYFLVWRLTPHPKNVYWTLSVDTAGGVVRKKSVKVWWGWWVGVQSTDFEIFSYLFWDFF